jgi:hypothetical protein
MNNINQQPTTGRSSVTTDAQGRPIDTRTENIPGNVPLTDRYARTTGLTRLTASVKRLQDAIAAGSGVTPAIQTALADVQSDLVDIDNNTTTPANVPAVSNPTPPAPR